MEPNSNAEKQARYRKKDKLRRQADQMLRLWQLEPKNNNFKSESEIRQIIESVINLPHGWTDGDYLNAEKKLDYVNSEIFSPNNQILNDIKSSMGLHLMLSNDMLNRNMLTTDLTRISFEQALEKTNALASHIISALKISDCDESEQAAALMEALRFVGRTLSNNRHVPCSDATAMCLSTISPMYDRPKWFSRQTSSALSKQITPDVCHEIAQYLLKE